MSNELVVPIRADADASSEEAPSRFEINLSVSSSVSGERLSVPAVEVTAVQPGRSSSRSGRPRRALPR